MTFRLYLCVMLIGTLLLWGSWSFVLWTMNPQESGIGGIVLFYVTLGMSLVGTFTLIRIACRFWLDRRKDLLTRDVRTAFRHALFLSTVAMTSLALSASNLLRWWMLIGLITVVGAIEYLFLVKESATRS